MHIAEGYVVEGRSLRCGPLQEAIRGGASAEAANARAGWEEREKKTSDFYMSGVASLVTMAGLGLHGWPNVHGKVHPPSCDVFIQGTTLYI
jgi:hypothetical protein